MIELVVVHQSLPMKNTIQDINLPSIPLQVIEEPPTTNRYVLNTEEIPSVNIFLTKNDNFESRPPKINLISLGSQSQRVIVSRRDTLSEKARNYNNLIFSTFEDSSLKKKIMTLITFVSTKIIIPLFVFAFVTGCIILAHSQIEDYCFYPSLCKCENFYVYLYTTIKEILIIQGGTIIFLYYGSSFVTNDFYNNKAIKCAYVFFMILSLCAYFAMDYFRRKENNYNEMVKISGFSLIGANYGILSIIGIFKKDITSLFFKKTLIVAIIQIYLFFHRFYIKGDAMFAILEQFLFFFGKNYGLNLFKMFLMFFNIIYTLLSRKMLLFFFRKILSEPKLSYNMGIFMIKFISADILSISAFNALTIPLDEFYSWISFSFYLYSVFSCYTRTNVILTIFKKMFGISSKKKRKLSDEKIIEEENHFNNLRSGCIFETNLIVFLRIISFKIFPYFLFFTPQSFLYENCSLEEKFDHFQLLDTNVIVLMVSHSLLLGVLGIVVYGFGKEQYLFDYQVENINVLGRFLFFLTFFAYADYSLQIYKSFHNFQINA